MNLFQDKHKQTESSSTNEEPEYPRDILPNDASCRMSAPRADQVIQGSPPADVINGIFSTVDPLVSQSRQRSSLFEFGELEVERFAEGKVLLHGHGKLDWDWSGCELMKFEKYVV